MSPDPPKLLGNAVGKAPASGNVGILVGIFNIGIGFRRFGSVSNVGTDKAPGNTADFRIAGASGKASSDDSGNSAGTMDESGSCNNGTASDGPSTEEMARDDMTTGSSKDGMIGVAVGMSPGRTCDTRGRAIDTTAVGTSVGPVRAGSGNTAGVGSMFNDRPSTGNSGKVNDGGARACGLRLASPAEDTAATAGIFKGSTPADDTAPRADTIGGARTDDKAGTNGEAICKGSKGSTGASEVGASGTNAFEARFATIPDSGIAGGDCDGVTATTWDEGSSGSTFASDVVTIGDRTGEKDDGSNAIIGEDSSGARIGAGEGSKRAANGLMMPAGVDELIMVDTAFDIAGGVADVDDAANADDRAVDDEAGIDKDATETTWVVGIWEDDPISGNDGEADRDDDTVLPTL